MLLPEIIFINGLIVKVNNMIFDYFFLKFYKGILKSSIPEFPRFVTSWIFGIFINLNLLILSCLLAKSDILPFLYSKTSITIQLFVLVLFIYLRYNKNRIALIKSKYATFTTDDEFFLRKKKFNIAFILYVIATILSIFVVPWIKPGYLPELF